MKMRAKKIICTVLIGIILMSASVFSGCSSDEDGKDTKVQVEMENGDTFIIELYPEYAPETVENFVKLVKEGFYDGLVFHRVYEGFMAQGGGYTSFPDNKKEAQTIKGEFKNNGFKQNTLRHTRGVISMARSDNYDSASSEFFIMYDDNKDLDGLYAAFGKVIEGMETIDKFLEVEKYEGMDKVPSHPVEPIVIKKMIIVE